MESPRITRSRLCKGPVRVVVDHGPKIRNNQKMCENSDVANKSPIDAKKLEPVSEPQTDEKPGAGQISVKEQTKVETNPTPGANGEALAGEHPVGEEKVETPVVPKRKRGRPRKNPEDAVAAKKLKFKPELSGEGPDEASLSEVVFPVTPYPGKTGSTRRIPRPPNAFMIFGKENRKRLSLQYAGSTNKDISKRLGEEWQSLDEETKAEYKESARKALEEHRNKHPNYQYSPTEARIRKKRKAEAKAAAECNRQKPAKLASIPQTSDFSEANKENIPPSLMPSAASDPPPARVIKELFIAPPGYEDVEIDGLEKFVLWEDKLIPYREWLGAEGDVKRLSGSYTSVPEQLLQPIADCIIAGTHLEAAPEAAVTEVFPAHEGQRDSGEVVNTMDWRESDDRTLHDCNAASSESDKVLHEAVKSAPEMDAQRLLHDLMSDVQTEGRTAAVVVLSEPQPDPSSSTRRLFWNEGCAASDDE